MIKVNLLPYREILRKENIITHALIAGAAGFLVIVIILFVEVVMSSKISALNNEISRIENEIKNNKVSIDEINKLKKEKETYHKQLKIIENLKKGKEGPVRILDELSSAIPDKIWLLTLKQSGSNLELVGVAVENKFISTFMSNLEASPYFKKVDLIASEMKVQTTGKVKKKLNRFTLTCLITSPSNI